MKKVQFFINAHAWDLKKELDAFLQRHTVTDMQYQITRRYDGLEQTLHCVMVVFEED
jgi:hypothetical protein